MKQRLAYAAEVFKTKTHQSQLVLDHFDGVIAVISRDDVRNGFPIVLVFTDPNEFAPAMSKYGTPPL